MDEQQQIEESFENQMHEAMQLVFSDPSPYMTLGEVTFENCHLVAQWWLENNKSVAIGLAREILTQEGKHDQKV